MIKFLVGFFAAIFIISLLVGGALGLVPGISSVLGASPKNLGQKITLADSLAAQNKTGIEVVSLPKTTPNNKGLIAEGKKPLSASFNSQELTALANNRTWKNFPVKNVQIRVNPDNTLESSGIIVVAKAIPFAEGFGYSASQVKEAIEKYKLPQIEIPYYIKGSGEVKNNDVSLTVSTMKIGVVPVPQNITDSAAEGAVLFLEDLMRKYQANFSAQSISVQNSELNFIGQVAEKIKVVSE